MIGRPLRLILTFAAYAVIVLGFIRGVGLLYPMLTDGLIPYGSGGLDRVAWAIFAGLVEGGVLLVLLSIDQRIQNRGS
jgi:hypothetical protein